MRSRVAVLFALVALAAVLALGAGCSAKAGGASSSASSSSETTSAPLAKFLDASVKTGKGSVSTTDETGKTWAFKSEFWVDGRKFRYDLYKDGTLIRSIQSPDGQKAYFVEYADKSVGPAVASVDRYLLEFSKPTEQAVEDGVDPETGATRMVYKVNKLDDISGADNAWLTTEVIYLVKDGNVVGVITKGDKPDKNGKIPPGELSVSRRIFDEVKIGGPVDAKVFELPFPVKPAE